MRLFESVLVRTDACRGQKRVLDPSELELIEVLRHLAASNLLVCLSVCLPPPHFLPLSPLPPSLPPHLPLPLISLPLFLNKKP